MPFTHVVAFRYVQNLSSEQKSKVADEFRALRNACKGVMELKAGLQVSTEGFHDNFEHVFVLRFKDRADLNYYLDEDPAHQAFKAQLSGQVEKVMALDFEEGIF